MDVLKILIILCLFLFACSGTNNVSTNRTCVGYWEDKKPWRGTNWQNKAYQRPYRQCVDKSSPFRNTFSD